MTKHRSAASIQAANFGVNRTKRRRSNQVHEFERHVDENGVEFWYKFHYWESERSHTKGLPPSGGLKRLSKDDVKSILTMEGFGKKSWMRFCNGETKFVWINRVNGTSRKKGERLWT